MLAFRWNRGRAMLIICDHCGDCAHVLPEARITLLAQVRYGTVILFWALGSLCHPPLPTSMVNGPEHSISTNAICYLQAKPGRLQANNTRYPESKKKA